MKNLIFKVLGYIVLRNAIFHFTLPFLSKEVKGVKLADLKNYEDWFMFSWLFLLPAVIEAIIFTFPFSYGLNKIETSPNKLNYYILFSVLFIVEYALNHWFIGLAFPFYKIGISIFLFILLFRKQLF